VLFRSLWKQIMQRIEYITGEVEKIQAEIDLKQSEEIPAETDTLTAFWLKESEDFSEKITAFENAAIGRLQVLDKN